MSGALHMAWFSRRWACGCGTRSGCRSQRLRRRRGWRRSGLEARIVQLDREIIAALAGTLRPGGADLRPADIDAVARRVVVAPVGLGDDADTLVWRLRVTISPWNSWPDFLNEPMLAMSLLLAVFELRDHRGVDGDLKADGDRRRTRSGEAQRRMAAVRLSCLARNGL